MNNEVFNEMYILLKKMDYKFCSDLNNIENSGFIRNIEDKKSLRSFLMEKE